jgi:hypothetical protein
VGSGSLCRQDEPDGELPPSSSAPVQREVISVHIGQAGVQMGNAAWELYCLEHGQGGGGGSRLCLLECTEQAAALLRLHWEVS